MKLLIVVDMQKDFIDGTLGTPEAQTILDNVVDKIAAYPPESVYVTRDTHTPDYLNSCEGRHLPVVHCVEGTPGHSLNPRIAQALTAVPADHIFDKPTFGSMELAERLRSLARENELVEIELVGLCTGICVLSNAILLKAALSRGGALGGRRLLRLCVAPVPRHRPTGHEALPYHGGERGKRTLAALTFSKKYSGADSPEPGESAPPFFLYCYPNSSTAPLPSRVPRALRPTSSQEKCRPGTIRLVASSPQHQRSCAMPAGAVPPRSLPIAAPDRPAPPARQRAPGVLSCAAAC